MPVDQGITDRLRNEYNKIKKSKEENLLRNQIEIYQKDLDKYKSERDNRDRAAIRQFFDNLIARTHTQNLSKENISQFAELAKHYGEELAKL